MHGLSDEHMSTIGRLQNLDLLELGNCSDVSSDAYKNLASLTKLTRYDWLNFPWLLE